MSMSDEKQIIVADRRGVQLTSMEDMYRFAVAVLKSGLAPHGMERPEAIVVAVQMGAELGLPPMASLQNIAVINGRPSIWGDAALAVCQQDRRFQDIEETYDPNTETATCAVTIRGRKKPVVRTFSRADAERAGLWNRRGRNGEPTPWVTYPQRMLQMRARAFALRDALPGALRGLYFAEEVRDFDDRPNRITAEVVQEEAQPPKTTLDDVVNSMPPEQPTPPTKKNKREIWAEIITACAEIGVTEDDLKNHIREKHGYKNLRETPLPYLEAFLKKQIRRANALAILRELLAPKQFEAQIAEIGLPLLAIDPEQLERMTDAAYEQMLDDTNSTDSATDEELPI